MSDPCIVGRLGGPTVTGVYIHVDGTPKPMLDRLSRIMTAHGVNTALDTLLRHRYGWAYLWPELDDGDADTNIGVPRHRGRVVPGYGFAYTLGPRMLYTLAEARAHPLIGWAYFVDPAGGDIHWWDLRPDRGHTGEHVTTVWSRA